jgi:predicted O-methyltransferase YrrM
MNGLVNAMFRAMGEPYAQKGFDIASHLPLLYVLAQQTPGQVVELGVGNGYSTIALLAGSKHSIELPGAAFLALERHWHKSGPTPPDFYTRAPYLISYDTDPTAEGRAKEIIGIDNWGWKFIAKDSTAASADFQNESVGLLFIDTLHTYEKTKEELEAWLPKIEPNGIICGHDYLLHLHEEKMWATLSGVHTAVDEFAKVHADRFRLQIFPNDRGLFVFWPRILD